MEDAVKPPVAYHGHGHCDGQPVAAVLSEEIDQHFLTFVAAESREVDEPPPMVMGTVGQLLLGAWLSPCLLCHAFLWRHAAHRFEEALCGEVAYAVRRSRAHPSSR